MDQHVFFLDCNGISSLVVLFGLANLGGSGMDNLQSGPRGGIFGKFDKFESIIVGLENKGASTALELSNGEERDLGGAVLWGQTNIEWLSELQVNYRKRN